MGTKRQEKFSRMIQKELAEIFQRQAGTWTHGNIVSVTQVEMSPDLSVAKASLSFIIDDPERVAFESLNQHKSEIRKMLGNRIAKSVRRIPELIFVFDEGAEHAARIDKILRDLNIPPKNEEE